VTTTLICPRCRHQEEAATLGVRCPRCPDHAVALVPPAEAQRNRDDPLLGRVLGGKYPLVGTIGRGGMGAVYLAIQEPIGRQVAIKVIRSGVGAAAGESLRARFFREARAVASLSHPSIVTLHDYGQEEDGTLYMVLELLRGRDLSRIVKEEGALPAERAVAITCQVLGALQEAHAAGLVHRDLKPQNIMLLPAPGGGDQKGAPWEGEQAKVLDFGIAKLLRSSDEGARETFETRQGIVVGTPHYMAPEQATGRTLGPATDLYALGVVLYELLAGSAPFNGTTPLEVLMAHQLHPVPPLPEALGLPSALELVIRRALAKDPTARWPDARSMAEALKLALVGGLVSDDEPTVPGCQAALVPTDELAAAELQRGQTARLPGGETGTPALREDAAQRPPDDDADAAVSGHGETLPATTGARPRERIAAGGFAHRPTIKEAPAPEAAALGPPRSRPVGLLLAGFGLLLALAGGAAAWRLITSAATDRPLQPASVAPGSGTAAATLPVAGSGDAASAPEVAAAGAAVATGATAGTGAGEAMVVTIRVTSVPAGAAVRLGRDLLGTTPFDWTPPPGVGPVTLLFSRGGYERAKVRLNPVPGAAAHAVLGPRRPSRSPAAGSGRALPVWEDDSGGN